MNNPKDDRRLIAEVENVKPVDSEIYKSGDSIKVRLDADNIHTLGKTETKITRDVNEGLSLIHI